MPHVYCNPLDRRYCVLLMLCPHSTGVFIWRAFQDPYLFAALIRAAGLLCCMAQQLVYTLRLLSSSTSSAQFPPPPPFPCSLLSCICLLSLLLFFPFIFTKQHGHQWPYKASCHSLPFSELYVQWWPHALGRLPPSSSTSSASSSGGLLSASGIPRHLFAP